jgi:hypothetical protein
MEDLNARISEADIDDIPEDVEEALRRQDEALALLEKLRHQEPFRPLPLEDSSKGKQEGNRSFRRWKCPETVTLELHDGTKWQVIAMHDMGIGGTRVPHLPEWAAGPTPGRLTAPHIPRILILSDVMWRDTQDKRDNRDTGAGLRFEFLDTAERDVWAEGLIDALLVAASIG